VGQDPRSMAISPDGTALYVVNYDVGSMSKIRTEDMKVLQTVTTDAHPIGITYEPTTQTVWVACYGGSILVFDDKDVT
jgi:YVTN family beta-propeller protein